MHYYKHDHHTGMNPKWRGIAAERGVRPLDVYGIWSLLLEHASRQQDRGSVARFSAADIAAQYDLEKSDVEAILTEFEARGMIAGRIPEHRTTAPFPERLGLSPQFRQGTHAGDLRARTGLELQLGGDKPFLERGARCGQLDLPITDAKVLR